MGIDPAGVRGGVVRAGDSGSALKARIPGLLIAEGVEVPRRFPAQALLVEAVAGALAAKEDGHDVPPDVGARIDAHREAAPVRQGVEPVIEPGEEGAQHPDQGLDAQSSIDARKRFAARRLATWPRIRPREWRLTWRMSFLSWR